MNAPDSQCVALAPLRLQRPVVVLLAELAAEIAEHRGVASSLLAFAGAR